MPRGPRQIKSNPEGLGRRVVRGGALLGAGTALERLTGLARNMVLTRIIAPDQFGVMAVTLATLALFQAITEVGVAQAVIQHERGHTPALLNVAWWFGVVRGFLVAALALPLAAPLASFYNMPELRPMLMLAPLSVVFAGVTSPKIYALQREFRFGATLWTMQGSGLLATAFTIAMGFWLRNVWALLLGTLFEAFARLVLSFVICPIRPRLNLDREAFHDLFRFTRGMAGLPLLTFLIMQSDKFVLGKVVTADILGLYTMAITLAAFPMNIFSKVVQPLVVPIFSRFQDDLGGMRNILLRISRLIWLFGLPMSAVMVAVSGPLLVLVYGRPEFSKVALPFSIYTIFAIVYMASMVTFSVYLAIAQPELQRRFTLVRAGLLVISLYPAIVWLGAAGAAGALLFAMIGAMVVQLVNLRRVIGLEVKSYLATVLPGLLVGTIMWALTVIVTRLPGIDAPSQVVFGATLGAICWSALLLRERRELRGFREPSNAG